MPATIQPSLYLELSLKLRAGADYHECRDCAGYESMYAVNTVQTVLLATTVCRYWLQARRYRVDSDIQVHCYDYANPSAGHFNCFSMLNFPLAYLP